jgi:hypothetical protein
MQEPSMLSLVLDLSSCDDLIVLIVGLCFKSFHARMFGHKGCKLESCFDASRKLLVMTTPTQVSF